MEKECARIKEGTCKKCSACDVCEFYKQPKEDNFIPFGCGVWGGKIIDILPHGLKHYLRLNR